MTDQSRRRGGHFGSKFVAKFNIYTVAILLGLSTFHLADTDCGLTTNSLTLTMYDAIQIYTIMMDMGRC